MGGKAWILLIRAIAGSHSAVCSWSHCVVLVTCINIAAELVMNRVRANLSDLEGEVDLGQSALTPPRGEAAKSRISLSSPGKRRQITAVNRVCASYENTGMCLCLSAQNPSNSMCCISLMCWIHGFSLSVRAILDKLPLATSGRCCPAQQ